MEQHKDEAGIKSMQESRCSHKRSAEKKRERNCKRKNIRKEKKKQNHLNNEEMQIQFSEKVRKLEFETSVLKRNFQQSKKTINSLDMNLTCSSRMIMHINQDKNAKVLNLLNFNIPEFSKLDVHIDELTVGRGVFGQVSKGYIISQKQKVAVKMLSLKCHVLDIIAECKKTMLMAEHPNFPFVFGFINPGYIIMEYICEDNGSTSPTLKESLSKTALPSWKTVRIGIDLCKAIHDLHTKGLLQNSIHSRNILIRNQANVKVIDFGKATLITDPVKYDIKPGSSRQIKFNTVHIFLAYELRNIAGSYQSVGSDIYSLGYNIDQTSRVIKNESVASIAMNMLNNSPKKRPPISRCVVFLEKIWF